MSDGLRTRTDVVPSLPVTRELHVDAAARACGLEVEDGQRHDTERSPSANTGTASQQCPTGHNGPPTHTDAHSAHGNDSPGFEPLENISNGVPSVLPS